MIKKKCTVSGQIFTITESDLDFYKKIGIISAEDCKKIKSRKISDCTGLPTLCPKERERRRLSWRNERKLYQRKCDLCEKMMISMYDKDVKFPVYCQNCWWSDNWDSEKFSRDFDFSCPFFEQFQELMKSVPMLSLWNHAGENAEFNNCCFNNKNCYMNFTTDKSEDCYYNASSDSCTDVIDSYEARSCELCYECIDCQNCYDSKFLQNCKNCQNSAFLKNCIGCNNCFGCVNLRNKEYWFLNQQLTKEEYQRKVAGINFKSRSQIEDLRKTFQQFLLKFPHKHAEFENCENCTGNYIQNSKNAQNCYDTQKAFDAKYCIYVTFDPIENTMDAYAIGGAKNCYEIISGTEISDSSFIVGINNGPHQSSYCLSCVNNCNYLFGCIGMRHSKYCILNKQYSKEEYFKIREKIIEHIKKTGEWGEFFPIKMSPFAYNETVADEYFPMSQKEILAKNWKWKEEKQNFKYDGPKVKIPDSISETTDNILKQILECDSCKKNYRLVKQELKFYQKIGLPVPSRCPNCRHAERIKLRNPRTLFERSCDKCSEQIQTTFAPDKPEKVYCEKCYLNKVD